MSESHGPNTNHSGWMRGRHWAVMFRCTRCRRVETVEYRREGNDGNLQCQQTPDNWVSRGEMLLCPNCAASFSDWMEDGR